MGQAKFEVKRMVGSLGSLPCEVDFRFKANAEGSKMFGGNGLMIPWMKSLQEGTPLSRELMRSTYQQLRKRGVTPGVHQGYHHIVGDLGMYTLQNNPIAGEYPVYNEIQSGCGLADGIREVARKIISQRDTITATLVRTYQSNPALQRYLAKEAGITRESFQKDVIEAYEVFERYDPQVQLPLEGSALIQQAAQLGAVVTNLVGNHDTKEWYLNIRKGVTFDKTYARLGEKQAFASDMPAVLEQADIVGIDRKKAALWNMIISAATAIALDINQQPKVHYRRENSFPEIPTRKVLGGECGDDRFAIAQFMDMNAGHEIRFNQNRRRIVQ